MKLPLNVLIFADVIHPIIALLERLNATYAIHCHQISKRKTAQSILKEGSIDLILVDVRSSELDDVNALTIVKNNRATIPTVMIGESMEDRLVLDFMKVGAVFSIANSMTLSLLIEQQLANVKGMIQLQKVEQLLSEKTMEIGILLNHDRNAILIHDYKKITHVNTAFLLQLEYKNQEELIGKKPLPTIVYSEDIARIQPTKKQAKSETTLIVPQVRLLKKDGHHFTTDVRIVSVLINGTWHAQIYLESLASQKSVQAYLEEKTQNNLLIKHVEQVSGVIYQFQWFEDGYFCFPFISDRVEDLYGISAKMLMKNARTFFKYIHEDDRERFVKAGQSSHKNLTEWRLDYRMQVPNEEIRWMSGNSKPVRMSDGSTLWYGYVADITEDKKAGAALRDSEEQIRTMLKDAPDAIALLGIDSKITKWNPKATAIFGWTEEEAVGRLLYQLIAPKRNHERYRKNIESYQNGGDGIVLNQALEVRAVHKNQVELSITMALSEMNIKGEQFLVCFMSDITKRKNAEEKVKQSLHEKEVLLKEIHHRVKNNMQVITSLLSLQSSFIEDQRIKDIFRNSQYRINSMGMVHEMLYQSENLSKIDYGNYLGRLIMGLIIAMKGEHNNIDLALEVPHITLNVDTAIPLGLIINELVTNSLKYGFPNQQAGQIFVKLVSLDYPNFRLEIGDDGVGFDSDKELKQSKSLGLMLVNGLAIQLKGTIEHLKTKEGTHYVLSFQEIYQFNS